MGKWKAVIPIVLALVMAGGGSLYVYNWLNSQTSSQAVKTDKSDMVSVAVAAVDLPWGSKLKPEMIKTVPFPKESLPDGIFSDVNQVVGRVIIAPFKRNEPIIEARMAPDSVTVGGVSALVKPGRRAIAVKGDAVIGLSGFINPMSRVDVLVTLTDPKTDSETTKIVLENILVLATGTQMQVNDKGEPAPVDVYTLEVTPEDGEKLALAASQGKLQLALRNIIDSETVLTHGATITQTLNSYRSNGAKPVAKKKPARRRSAPRHTVEIIKGDVVSKKKLKL